MPIHWDMGIAVGSFYDADGHLAIQYDAEGTEDGGQGGVEPYEAQSIAGNIYRPSDPVLDGNGNPDATQSATVLFGMEGGRGHSIPLGNPAVVKNMPVALPGEHIVHGDQGSFIRFHEDGSISLFTTTAGGAPTFPSGVQAESVQLILAPTGLTFSAPWGNLKYDATGLHALTKSGARLDLGGIFGLPAPLDKLTSYAALQANTVTLDGSTVHCGPDTGTSSPVTSATALIEYLTAQQAVIPALAATVFPAQVATAQSAVATLDPLLAVLAETLPLATSSS